MKNNNAVTNGIKKIPVIIVAAGSSRRMGGTPKQFIELAGVPVIARTLLAFQNSEVISEILVVTKAEFKEEIRTIADEYNIGKLSCITEGGNSREESVKNGVENLSADETCVLIHDAARPFVTDGVIRAVSNALENADAVICGVPLKDTVKILNTDNTVLSTPDRNSMFCVQTPQGVKIDKFRHALSLINDLGAFTDDASVMEKAGYTVFTVEGDYNNIKITTPDDLELAEYYIKKSGDVLCE